MLRLRGAEVDVEMKELIGSVRVVVQRWRLVLIWRKQLGGESVRRAMRRSMPFRILRTHSRL